MVTATRGGHTVEVSMGAYRELFAPLGYVLVESNEKRYEVPDAEYVDGYDDGSYEEEKPISDMDFKELKKYASKLGINTAGMSKKRELRSAIMEAMHE